MDKDFKLIAIRPLKNCNIRFLKNLTPGKLYQFYNDYKFIFRYENGLDDDLVIDIDYKSTYPEDLYEINKGQSNSINVNISAIVGKNGSGKSSLLELLYLGCYAISTKEGIINDQKYFPKKFNETGDDFYVEIINDIQETIEGLNVEYYFAKGEKIFVLKNLKSEYGIFQLINRDWKKRKLKLDDFFYSIIVNYSIYGLNSSLNNRWLNPLFHKNDGYKTPIVINPYRDKGNININAELHFAQTRTLLNLISDDVIQRYVIGNKELDFLKFEIYPESLESFNPHSFSTVFRFHKQNSNEDIIDFFSRIIYNTNHYKFDERTTIALKKLLEADINSNANLSKHTFKSNETQIDYIHILYLSIKYSIKKIFKICTTYDDFREFLDYADTKRIPYITNQQLLTQKLIDDKSHITLKLKQILYSIKENYFNNSWETRRNPDNRNHKIFTHVIPIEKFTVMIREAKEKNLNTDPQNLIPIAFFKPTLYLKNNRNDNSSTDFGILSSGEQQLVHSIQSILYHIINLNSVFKSVDKQKVKYSNINIVLDEIELYYHPEYQKNFIKHFLSALENLKIENIQGINILFSTHSPFILSDIPHQNILKLENGHPKKYDSLDKTFGSNIHNLLANDFFLSGGTIGEYAKSKIQKIIDFLNNAKKFKQQNSIQFDILNLDKENILNTISIIGDDIVRNKLLEVYLELFHDNLLIEKEIENLSKKIENLKNQKR